MANIEEGKRISKRILLSNLLTNDYNLAVTPLLSGKHGIGKSQVPKAIAKDLNGTCIVIEGGTLKEGEITGIPYQYKNELNQIEFKFLPYYVIKRIQEAEKILNNELKKEDTLDSILEGDENKYSNNDISFEEKVRLIKLGKVKPVILFFDEMNRTDNSVFRELMNIILTRTVNGYKFPWWVFIIAAINPSSQNSVYATNEMDPAQLDRFIKIKVREDSTAWVNYALNNDFDESLVNFIANHEKCLSDSSEQLEDSDVATPSPRSWEMIDLILKGKNKLNEFFNESELKEIDSDIKTIINSKVGATAGAMYFSSLKEKNKVLTYKDILDFNNEKIDDKVIEILKEQSTLRNSITSKNIIEYLKNNFDDFSEIKIKLTIDKLANYIHYLDKSSKIVFSQWLVNLKTVNNNDPFDKLYPIFDKNKEVFKELEYTNINKYKIENAK